MHFQAIAFDLDGTLLDSQRQIRPSSIAAIHAARAKGIEVLITTGRHHMVTRPYHHQLNLTTPAICCNGAYLYDFLTQSTLAANPVSMAQAEQFLSLANQHKIVARVLTTDALNYVEPDRTLRLYIEWGHQLPEELKPVFRHFPDYADLLAEEPLIYSFVVVSDNYEQLKAFERDIVSEIGLSCEWFAKDGFDIANHGNSKGARLLEWAKKQNIPAESIIAFGDNHNDTSMLEVVGLGVAMGNAAEYTKDVADIIANGTNNSDVIADIIAKYAL
ncbi:pyridoxal phosphatase [Microvirga sp. W0021]|uniref:Pyridoxal phosphatase n=1 Tax=Hohaiivirga grylli TaxID=3133970 RepID=A0ABV0BKN1_9HYPH